MESHLPTVSKPSRISPDDSVESTLAGMAQWRPFRGPFERWPHLMDVLIALLAFLLTLLMWSREANWNVVAIDSVGDLWVFIAANVASFALLWRRSHPWQVHAVVLGLSILIFITGPDGGDSGHGLFVIQPGTIRK